MPRTALMADTGSPTYFFWTGSVTIANNKIMMDIFNATGSGKKIKIINVMVSPVFTAAVTGIASSHSLQKTTTVGTGGTTNAGIKADDNDPALPAGITSRAAPTGGAAAATGSWGFGLAYTEEAINQSSNSIIYQYSGFGKPITLNENQGVSLLCTIGGTAAGSVRYVVEAIVE